MLRAKTKCLTVALCFFLSGTGTNKAVLLQFQQEREEAKQQVENYSQVYDNVTYEDSEIKQESHSCD